MATALSEPLTTRAVRGRFPVEEIDATQGLTPRVERLKQRYLAVKSQVVGDRAWYMMESFKKTEGEHLAIRRAKAFADVLANMRIAIHEDEILAGAVTHLIRGAHPNVELAPLNLEVLLQQHVPPTTTSEAQESLLDDEDKEKLLAACDYWRDKYTAKRAEEMMTEHTNGKWKQFGEARIGMCQPHTPMVFTPGADYDHLLEVGFNGLIEQARGEIEKIRSASQAEPSEEDQEKLAFLESVIISLEGMIHLAKRYADLARELAAKASDPERKLELEKVAEVCEWVPANPPRSFQEALQLYWFVCIGQDIEKANPNAYIGRFDQYMWPYYAKDIDEGVITRQQAAELLGCMFMKWTGLEPFLFMGLLGKRYHQDIAQANYFANLTLGGVDRRGRDASNELSCLILQVAKQVRTHQPHISIRWHRTMAPEFLDKGIECNRDHGAGIPAWFSDRVGTEYLMDRGVATADAREWAMAGCINTSYPKSFAWSRGAVVSFLNHAKMLEFALSDGVDPVGGEPLGTQTGDPRNFETFDDVVAAYKKQVDDFYDYSVDLHLHLEKVYYEDSTYFPFCSAFLQDCIASGKDATRGGGRYQELEAFCFVDRGMQDVSDSLIAMKKLIFEEKKVTMDELLEAVKADFEGYEELRHMLLAQPKYGNDQDEPDDLAVELWEYARDRSQQYRDGQGRRFTMFRQGAAWSTWAGRMTGALPNGRKAGTSLADASASPQQGCDVCGPTATMNSVSKLDAMGIEGPLLNMKFAPGMLKSQKGKQKFADLMATYFDQGGNHVQFNILDRQTLLDAQANPEDYRNLVVRVAGYSAFWVELTPAVQEEIISRTEQAF
jgi:formate C-acetyltransferase